MTNFNDYLALLAERILREGFRGVLFIMRGVPGSGKSYTALQLSGGNKDNIMSADKFFSRTDDHDEYRRNWAPKKLFAAHNWCRGEVRDAMRKGITPIVLDNTNIKRREFMPYIDLAKQYQYIYEIRESESPWWLEIRDLLKDQTNNAKALDSWAKKLSEGFEYEGKTIKNGHGVPEEVIKRMLYTMQPYHHGGGSSDVDTAG